MVPDYIVFCHQWVLRLVLFVVDSRWFCELRDQLNSVWKLLLVHVENQQHKLEVVILARYSAVFNCEGWSWRWSRNFDKFVNPYQQDLHILQVSLELVEAAAVQDLVVFIYVWKWQDFLKALKEKKLEELVENQILGKVFSPRILNFMVDLL